MVSAAHSLSRTLETVVPSTMKAAVYRGINDVRIETVAVPEIESDELLIRVHTCGICGTDLKKISTGSHSAPRIFGHETSGIVARVGPDVRAFRVGDRVMEELGADGHERHLRLFRQRRFFLPHLLAIHARREGGPRAQRLTFECGHTVTHGGGIWTDVVDIHLQRVILYW